MSALPSLRWEMAEACRVAVWRGAYAPGVRRWQRGRSNEFRQGLPGFLPGGVLAPGPKTEGRRLLLNQNRTSLLQFTTESGLRQERTHE